MKILDAGEIQILFDLEHADAPIRWRALDGEPSEWDSTPYQTADAGHREDLAIELVTRWVAASNQDNS